MSNNFYINDGAQPTVTTSYSGNTAKRLRILKFREKGGRKFVYSNRIFPPKTFFHIDSNSKPTYKVIGYKRNVFPYEMEVIKIGGEWSVDDTNLFRNGKWMLNAKYCFVCK